MKKLTAEVALRNIHLLKEMQSAPNIGLSMRSELFLQALEKALPVLEQEEKQDEQQVDTDGWIEWKGGDNPAEGKYVQVEFRDGFIDDEQPSGSYRWYHEPNNCDIIAYRVVEQERERGEEE